MLRGGSGYKACRVRVCQSNEIMPAAQEIAFNNIAAGIQCYGHVKLGAWTAQPATAGGPIECSMSWMNPGKILCAACEVGVYLYHCSADTCSILTSLCEEPHVRAALSQRSEGGSGGLGSTADSEDCCLYSSSKIKGALNLLAS